MTVFTFASTLSFKDRLSLWVTIIKPEEFYLHTWMTLGNSWSPAGGRVGQGSGAVLHFYQTVQLPALALHKETNRSLCTVTTKSV